MYDTNFPDLLLSGFVGQFGHHLKAGHIIAATLAWCLPSIQPELSRLALSGGGLRRPKPPSVGCCRTRRARSFAALNCCDPCWDRRELGIRFRVCRRFAPQPPGGRQKGTGTADGASPLFGRIADTPLGVDGRCGDVMYDTNFPDLLLSGFVGQFGHHLKAGPIIAATLTCRPPSFQTGTADWRCRGRTQIP
jgi:hypothetical protein